VLAASVAVATSVAPGVAGADTATTFQVDGGTLSISAPATADLGSAAPGASLSTALGAITVTDTRANLDAAWTASAATSDFVTGGGTAAETVGASSISYASGASTATTGLGVFTPGQASVAAAAAMTAPVTAFTLTGGTGNNSATWNPTIVIAVPAAAVAGSYTGTITQSVA
jgi:hypothetical protein